MGVGQEEAPHVLQVVDAESSAETGGQVGGQSFDQSVAVTGALLAFLLRFDNPAADIPIAGRHQGIDIARGRLPCAIEQFDDAVVNTCVAGWRGKSFSGN